VSFEQRPSKAYYEKHGRPSAPAGGPMSPTQARALADAIDANFALFPKVEAAAALRALADRVEELEDELSELNTRVPAIEREADAMRMFAAAEERAARLQDALETASRCDDNGECRQCGAAMNDAHLPWCCFRPPDDSSPAVTLRGKLAAAEAQRDRLTERASIVDAALAAILGQVIWSDAGKRWLVAEGGGRDFSDAIGEAHAACIRVGPLAATDGGVTPPDCTEGENPSTYFNALKPRAPLGEGPHD